MNIRNRDSFALERKMEADRLWEGPPFLTFKQLVRHQATRWPVDMLAPRLQRAAERDPELERVGDSQTYRRRRATSPAPLPGTLGGAEAPPRGAMKGFHPPD